MEAPRTLVLLPYSPWSERASWALDHHDLVYRRVDHVPVIGERRLRRWVGRREGPATVPVLIEGDTVLTQSWDVWTHPELAQEFADLVRWRDELYATRRRPA